jgi:Na+-driven multidrug efflux pump
MKLGAIFSVIMAVCLVVSTPSILSIYKVSAEVQKSTFYLLYITAFIFPVRFINILLIVGILRGAGNAEYALKIEMITMWLVGVPICAVGAFLLHLKVHEVFVLVTLEEWTKFALAVFKYKKGNWIKSLVCNVKQEPA